MDRRFHITRTEDTCADLVVITDAEWSDEPSPLTGCATLRILDTEPAVCHFPFLSEETRALAAASAHHVCYDPSEPF